MKVLKKTPRKKRRLIAIMIAVIVAATIYFWIVPQAKKAMNRQNSKIDLDSSQKTEAVASQPKQANINLSTKNNQSKKLVDSATGITRKDTAKATTTSAKKIINTVKKKPPKKQLLLNKKNSSQRIKTQMSKKKAPEKEIFDSEAIKKAIQGSNFLNEKNKAKLSNHYGIK